MMALKKITHVMFDMDGLLLNSEELYSVAYQNVIGRYGKDYNWDFKVTLMGLHGHEIAERIIDHLNLPISKDEFMRETRVQFETLFPTVELMPGAKRLLQHLHENHIPMALATSSSQESADLKISHHLDIFSLFGHMVMGSSDPDVKLGKPHPDIFLVCASRFPDKPDPTDCLVFEDAPNGVKAALSAGMQVVMVPDSRLDKSLTQEASLVLSSLEDFQPQMFGLPAFVV